MDTTANKLWDSLNIAYEDKSLLNKIYLKWQLYNMKMKDKVLIYDHLNEFDALITDLQGIRVKIDKKNKQLYFIVKYQIHGIISSWIWVMSQN